MHMMANGVHGFICNLLTECVQVCVSWLQGQRDRSRKCDHRTQCARGPAVCAECCGGHGEGFARVTVWAEYFLGRSMCQACLQPVFGFDLMRLGTCMRKSHWFKGKCSMEQ